MAHYAFLDENNIVQAVYVGIDENNLDELPDGFNFWEEYYSNQLGMTCKRTSYNTFGNEHKDNGTPFRGNYAGIGFTYDEENDVFYSPQPFDSWIINETTWLWEAPTPMPDDGNMYMWNEDTQSWDLIVE